MLTKEKIQQKKVISNVILDLKKQPLSTKTKKTIQKLQQQLDQLNEQRTNS
jgi:hypothetical protein|tara:strand:- start:206 stop:358 length:153 start_codon:yes stop_codon:yes gene_type:complete